MAEDIQISVGIDLLNVQSQLSSLKSMLKEAGKSIETLKLQDVMGDLSPAGKKALSSLQIDSKLLKKEIVQTQLNAEKLGTTMKKLKGQQPFAGWALTLALFGMQLRAVFDNIWRQSSKTFTDVMHSVEGTVTGFDMLNGSVTYLQYAVGAALEPIAQWLAPIITDMAQWVVDNQEIARTFLIIFGVLGLVFSIIGQGKLLIDGLTTAFKLFGAGAATSTAEAGAAVSALSIPIWAVVLIVIAAAALIAAAWKTNFANIQDLFSILWTSVVAIFGRLKEAFKGLITFFEGIFEGDIKKIFAGLFKIIANLVAGILDIVVGLGSAIGNVLIWIANTVKNIFFGIVNTIIEGISDLLSWINNLAASVGVDLDLNVDSAKEFMKTWQEGAEISYITTQDVKDRVEAIGQFTDTMTKAVDAWAGIETKTLSITEEVTAQDGLFGAAGILNTTGTSTGEVTNNTNITLNLEAGQAQDPKAIADLILDEVNKAMEKNSL